MDKNLTVDKKPAASQKTIILNGAKFATKSDDLLCLKEELAGLNMLEDFDICIVDGFATSENLKIEDGANVIFIKKGVMPKADVLKSMIEARNSPSLNVALNNATIGIAGVGGLGSNIAVSLARVGVARIVVADFDIVEPSNLNRQHYFVEHIGMKKTTAIKELIAKINPFVEVIAHDIYLDESNVAQIFAHCSIICEAFDNPKSKAMIVNEAGRNLSDKTVIAASGMAGFHSSNLIKSIKFASNVYLCGDLENEAKVGQGLMAPRVGVCANHQANLALRVLMGLEI